MVYTFNGMDSIFSLFLLLSFIAAFWIYYFVKLHDKSDKSYLMLAMLIWYFVGFMRLVWFFNPLTILSWVSLGIFIFSLLLNILLITDNKVGYILAERLGVDSKVLSKFVYYKTNAQVESILNFNSSKIKPKWLNTFQTHFDASIYFMFYMSLLLLIPRLFDIDVILLFPGAIFLAVVCLINERYNYKYLLIETSSYKEIYVAMYLDNFKRALPSLSPWPLPDSITQLAHDGYEAFVKVIKNRPKTSAGIGIALTGLVLVDRGLTARNKYLQGELLEAQKEESQARTQTEISMNKFLSNLNSKLEKGEVLTKEELMHARFLKSKAHSDDSSLK